MIDNDNWTNVKDVGLPEQKYSNRGVRVMLTLNHRTVISGIFDEGNFYDAYGVRVLNVADWQLYPVPPVKKDNANAGKSAI